MARIPLLPRLLRQQSDPSEDSPAPASAAAAPAPSARRRPAPAVGELRRERRALLRVREERLRDLGGLALEMYRRDRFREDLILERCAELIGVEARVHELDTLLGGSRAARARSRCECGAPLLLGTRFCANCGRPRTEPTSEAR